MLQALAQLAPGRSSGQTPVEVGRAISAARHNPAEYSCQTVSSKNINRARSLASGRAVDMQSSDATDVLLLGEVDGFKRPEDRADKAPFGHILFRVIAAVQEVNERRGHLRIFWKAAKL
jgi:hypothetical protein